MAPQTARHTAQVRDGAGDLVAAADADFGPGARERITLPLATPVRDA